ncbi:MAG: S8 family serine peptidase [Acidimicrobiales bacterium]
MTSWRFFKRGRAGLVTVVALLGLLTTATPGGAQAGPEPSDFEAVGGLEAEAPGSADKAPSSMLAQTDPELLGRSDAAPVQVVVKLDYDSVATYQGTVEGLDATSPSVTGEPLTGESAAEQEYGAYIDEQTDAFVAELAQQVPEADVGSRIDVVYGGLSATVPANRVEDVLAIDGVVAVQQNKLAQPLTDSSGEFIGAPTIYDALGTTANAGEGVIYGNLDTGIWPEHPSFEDLGNLDAPPAPPGGGTRECNYGDNPLTPAADVFVCQSKLIGGAHFTDAYDSNPANDPDPLAGTARDGDGHGTHTSSTSAGNIVEDVEVLGIDREPIAGIAPGAWVMEYKVCGPEGCVNSDSARAVGQAILDGVDVINFSISGGEQPFNDVVELAFLDAYAAGVFVSASAGNEGPGAGTANHLSPWTTSVAASTQTREFASALTLTASNGDTFTADGATITAGIDPALPVVLAGTTPGYNDPLCGTPAPAGLFTGQLVACERGGDFARVTKGFNVLQGGAAGMILYNPTLADIETDNHHLPTIHLPDGTDFLAFMQSHTGVTGGFPAGQARDGQGDVLAAFSSRGPAGGFIKPDVTAPGVQIMAGNTPFPGDPGVGDGPPGEFFQAIAGTSMSSPHIAGSGILLRALHPEWSPGQIRSALMTSSITDLLKEDLTTPADPFDMGAGRVDLTQAGSVPLTFDETADRFFALGADPANTVHLNIPSINAPVMPGRVTTTRTALNVSGRRQRFTVSVDQPAVGSIEVSPSRFTLGAGQSVTLNVTIEAPVPNGQQFGTIDIDAQRGSSMHLPVAFVPVQGDVNLSQSCSPISVQERGTSACTVAAANNSFADTTVDLFTEVRGGLRVAGTDGGEWTGSRTAELTNVTIEGQEPGIPAVDPGSVAGFIPLDQFPGTIRAAVGDEQFVNLNTPVFTYAGQTWSRLGVTSNGYSVVGGASPEDVNCCNVPDGADPARPNNVLAPFWTDLDGRNAPGILANVLTDGVNSWLVVESQLRIFGTTDVEPSQIWIGIDGPEDVTYAYPADDRPSDPAGMDFLVGAENVLGEGDMEAVLPTGDLRVTSTDFVPGDTASYIVFVRGQQRGTFPVITSMNAEGVPGTTIVQTDLTVVRRTGGAAAAQPSSGSRPF